MIMMMMMMVILSRWQQITSKKIQSASYLWRQVWKEEGSNPSILTLTKVQISKIKTNLFYAKHASTSVSITSAIWVCEAPKGVVFYPIWSNIRYGF